MVVIFLLLTPAQSTCIAYWWVPTANGSVADSNTYNIAR
jgi:hypothetical protein